MQETLQLGHLPQLVGIQAIMSLEAPKEIESIPFFYICLNFLARAIRSHIWIRFPARGPHEPLFVFLYGYCICISKNTTQAGATGVTEVSASKLGKEALEGTVSASAAKSRAGPEAIGATEYFRLFIWSTIFLRERHQTI